MMTYSATPRTYIESIRDCPTAALHLRHHFVGRRVTRVHDVQIAVSAIAPRGTVRNKFTVLAPGVECIAAFSIGQQIKLAVPKRI